MPPPPPPPPGPPPAPGPPPPPTFNQANTQPPKLKKSEAANRNALLGSIENFKPTGLKKTKHLMVDKSAPAVTGSVNKANKFNTYSGAHDVPPSGGRTLPGGWMNQVAHKKGPAPPCPSTGPRQFRNRTNSPCRVIDCHSNGITGQHQIPRLGSVRQNTAPEIAAKSGGAGAASGPKPGSVTVGRTGGNRVQPPQGLGGLFAGGMPQLKSTGNRFAAETSNNSTDSGAHRSGVGNRYGGQANQQQSTAAAQYSQAANMKRHQSVGDIHNMARNFSNQGPPALPNQRPAASGGTGAGGRTAGGVKKWPPVAAGQGTTTNGRLGNHDSGGQPQSSMPPQPPPSTNRPSRNQFSHNQPSHVNTGASSGIGNHMHVGTGHQRDKPLPEVPNFAGGATPRRGGAGGGSAGGAPPPPPPARTQQTSIRRKSSSGGASSSSSNGMGSPRSPNTAPGTRTTNANRPLPPAPCQPPSASAVRAPPPPPARNPSRPLPSPPPFRHTQPTTNYRPSRPPGGAPPPPPPAREPNQGGPPPPPPPRVGPGQTHGNVVGYNTAFESQFRFVDISRLPPPEPFSNKTKTYPSKNPKNPAAQANGNARRYHPAH